MIESPDMSLILARLDSLDRAIQGVKTSPWLTVREASDYLRCSPRKIESLTARGLLPFCRQDPNDRQESKDLSPAAPDRLRHKREKSGGYPVVSCGKAPSGGVNGMMATFQGQTIYQGDFLRDWQNVGDGTVGLVVCDPPYGSLKAAWDVRPDFHVVAWIFDQLLSPAGQIAIFGDSLTTAEIQTAFERYFRFRFSWIWQKPSVVPGNSHKPACDFEIITIYARKGAKIKDVTFNLDDIRRPGKPYTRPAGKSQNQNPTRRGGGNMPEVFANITGDRFPRSIVKFNNKPCFSTKERVPGIATQKPVALAEMIIKALSNPGDTILDCFLGSGTTLIAAHRQNRNGIGFEQFPDHYAIARNRLERETAQGVLL